MIRKIKLKPEVIQGKKFEFTKEQSLLRDKRGDSWTVPTVRAFYKGKEILSTSYSNPKSYLIGGIRMKLNRGELK